MNGWIKLHRQIIDSPIFKNEKGLKIWVWCLIKANHKDNVAFKGRQNIVVNKGQFLMGLNKASEVLDLAKTTIKYWLDFLEKEGMVELKKTNKYTIVTIKNWDTFQEVELKKNSKRTLKETNKNEKNEKNEKNITLPKARVAVKFPSKDYKEVISHYEKLKGVKFSGNEYSPIQQTIKSMFMAGRTKDQIIKCMQSLNSSELPHWQTWNINTVQKQIPLFVSGKLNF